MKNRFHLYEIYFFAIFFFGYKIFIRKDGDEMKDFIIPKVIKNLGVIYLNNPRKLNALNFEMIKKIREILEKWEGDENIKAVLFDSLTDKAFCSGGDLKDLYNNFINKDSCKRKDEFFATEFELDKYIASYKKPLISHWRGIVMGGGIGLSINSDYIISEESVNWAMPETSLGFVPDVGVCNYISRLPKALGHFVGILGRSLEASDLVKYNFSHVYIDSKDYEKLIEKLIDLSEIYEGEELIEKLKIEGEKYNLPVKETFVDKNYDKIEKYFNKDSLEEIYKSLEENLEDEFAREIYDDLKSRSQFMLQVQFEKYFLCKNLTYHETVDLDLKVLNYALEIGEMEKGIKSKVIDKDYQPKWREMSLEDVEIEEVKKLLEVEK